MSLLKNILKSAIYIAYKNVLFYFGNYRRLKNGL